MAYEIEKSTGDIVVNGFEQGIQPSPHKGIANLQNVNISTEMMEVMPSFARVQDTINSVPTTAGTLSATSGVTPTGSISYLIVGGGGGGGGGNSNVGGGGGGGGNISIGTATIGIQSYTITVGGGGAGGAQGATGITGGTSSALSVSSTGGVGGAGASANASGGVGGTSGSGETGGTGASSGGGASNGGGGGGGGNSTTGTNGSTTHGGNGGAGTSNSLSGSAVTYGGGGGGGGLTGGTGGTGGGGTGGGSSATAGLVNTGGGGGASNGNASAAGGSGIVILSVPTGTIVATGGLKTTVSGNDIYIFTTSGTFTVLSISGFAASVFSLSIPGSNNLFKGNWITVSASSNATEFPNGNYYVVPNGVTYNLSSFYNGSPIQGVLAGVTATINLVASMGKPLASAKETYKNNGVVYNRYYILDNQNLVWVYDSINEILYPNDNVTWFLPDYNTNWCTSASGIAVISGFLVGLAESGVYGKSVALLGNSIANTTAWTQFNDITGWNGATASTAIIHAGYVGHQGRLYITDGNYLALIQPDSTIANSGVTGVNTQSFCVVSNESTTEGVYSIISGTSPVTSDGLRLPVIFFSSYGGSLPSSITAGTVYYIGANDSAFQTYTAPSGGTALDLQSGQTGTLYFNTFYPIATASAYDGMTPTFEFVNQQLTLPSFEIAQCMAEIGNELVIGCLGNTLYVWSQSGGDAVPNSLIFLPESNVQVMITVHQMVYIFPGNKGNIYLTDGSVASAVTTVPDYCAGIPGIPVSYIEPIFQWGGAMYLRGRVYFSVLDQTTIKVGNCGGVWSFVPTQNLFIGQDVGISTRLENQSSYGIYSGYAPVLIPKENQYAISPQYFSGWVSDINIPSYGIDSTGTTFSPIGIIETDAIPTGTMLEKKTFTQIEFKLSSPLLTGDIVTLFYRKSLTGAWISCGTVQLQNDRLSGYVSANFEKSQWLQVRILLNSAASFIRLSEIRIR